MSPISDVVDGLVQDFNLHLEHATGKRGMRVMRYARCIAYVFEDVGGLHFDERQDSLIKRLAKELGARCTILDLATCNTATSTALGFWADIITQSRLNGGRVLMVNPNEFVLRSIRMVGLDRLCEPVADIERALAQANDVD